MWGGKIRWYNGEYVTYYIIKQLHLCLTGQENSMDCVDHGVTKSRHDWTTFTNSLTDWENTTCLTVSKSTQKKTSIVNVVTLLFAPQISSVQSLSPVWLFATPWIAAHQASLSHHQLPEFTLTHVHQVGEAIQPSHLLLSPSPPAPNLSQHQNLFQWVNSSHEVAKVLEFQL